MASLVIEYDFFKFYYGRLLYTKSRVMEGASRALCML